MKVLVLSFVFCAFSAALVDGLSSEEATEVTETCCSYAEGVAVAATSLAQCTALAPPEEIEPDQLDTCKTAIKSCCEQFFKAKDDCAAGMKLAAKTQCNALNTDIGKICCQECLFGKQYGESMGAEACGEPASEGVSPTAALRKNSFHQCCLNAS